MRRRRVVFFLLFVFLFPCFSCYAEETLAIEDVRALAQKNSNGLQEVKIDKIKKQIELKQAQDGIADIRKKESTIRFSLLFNIKFPESHGMPKEIELIMKVPQIQEEITVLQRQETYELLKSQTEAETAFYDVLQEEHNQSYLAERIQDSARVLERITQQYQLGKGKKEDVLYMENQLQNYQNEYQKSILSYDQKTKKLSGLLGRDVQAGYHFVEYFPQVVLERRQLSEITAFAKEHDFGVFQKTQERKLAEKDTAEILDIYKNRYGSYISDIEGYIRAHEGLPIDYEEFIQMYNHTLTQIESPWANDFVINLLFFKIRIPKEWFKGEYSGVRYMEDQKYALFVSLTERDKARNAEQKKIAELEDTIYLSYSIGKQMESALENAEKNLSLAEKSYEEKKKQNQLGLVSFSSLESTREDYYNKQNSYFEMKMEYAKSLSAFNLTTGGYINYLLEGGSWEERQMEAGNSVLETPSWYVRNDLTRYTFLFGVNIPEEYGVDAYQLFYEGIPVGEKQPLEKQLIHMPLTYADSSLLEVRLYEGETVKYTGTFAGEQYGGELALQKAPEQTADTEQTEKVLKNPSGNWKLIRLDDLRSEFSLSVEELAYTEYEVFYQQNSVGKVEKGQTLQTLSLYFSDLEEMSVYFYFQGKQVAAGSLQEGQNEGQIAFVKEGSEN